MRSCFDCQLDCNPCFPLFAGFGEREDKNSGFHEGLKVSRVESSFLKGKWVLSAYLHVFTYRIIPCRPCDARTITSLRWQEVMAWRKATSISYVLLDSNEKKAVEQEVLRWGKRVMSAGIHKSLMNVICWRKIISCFGQSISQYMSGILNRRILFYFLLSLTIDLCFRVADKGSSVDI